MRVVVGGGHGFLGRAAMHAIEAAGHEAVAVGRGEAARGDVLVWAAGKRLPDLAANREVHVTAAALAARATGASRVIYLSSGECYGDAPLPWREDGPALGISAYARAKLEGELAVTAIAPTVALRIAVVYGPGQASSMLIPSLVAGLRAGQRVPLADGEQTRDFVFVDDVARAIVASLDAAPGTINIGSGQETRVRDVCVTLGRLLGGEHLLGFGERPRRPDEDPRYVLDVERAARVLDWRATTPLDVGLARL